MAYSIHVVHYEKGQRVEHDTEVVESKPINLAVIWITRSTWSTMRRAKVSNTTSRSTRASRYLGGKTGVTCNDSFAAWHHEAALYWSTRPTSRATARSSSGLQCRPGLETSRWFLCVVHRIVAPRSSSLAQYPEDDPNNIPLEQWRSASLPRREGQIRPDRSRNTPLRANEAQPGPLPSDHCLLSTGKACSVRWSPRRSTCTGRICSMH